MKILLSFLFSIPLFFNLNAQAINNRTLFTGSILLDKYIQPESYTLNSPWINYGIAAGNPSNFLSDGEKMRGQLSLGLKKINEKGNYIAVNIFAGLEKWERRALVEIENEDFGKLDIPIVVGLVEQNNLGVNATKSFCITKQETRLRAYLGARAEGTYTIGRYGSELENIFEINRQKVDFQIAFVPKALYFFPGDRFIMSMAMHLLPIGVELRRTESFDPNLTEEQSVSNYHIVDFMNHQKSRFEIGFGWLL